MRCDWEVQCTYCRNPVNPSRLYGNIESEFIKLLLSWESKRCHSTTNDSFICLVPKVTLSSALTYHFSINNNNQCIKCVILWNIIETWILMYFITTFIPLFLAQEAHRMHLYECLAFPFHILFAFFLCSHYFHSWSKPPRILWSLQKSILAGLPWTSCVSIGPCEWRQKTYLFLWEGSAGNPTVSIWDTCHWEWKDTLKNEDILLDKFHSSE